MAAIEHKIVFLSYNSVVKIMWVEVDDQRRPIIGVEPDGIDAAILKLKEDLEEEDRRREEEEQHRVKTYSKLQLCLGLQALGKLDAFKAWLSQSGYEFLFTQAQNLSSENQMFSEAVAVVQAALELTDEQVASVLKNAEINEN